MGKALKCAKHLAFTLRGDLQHLQLTSHQPSPNPSWEGFGMGDNFG